MISQIVPIKQMHPTNRTLKYAVIILFTLGLLIRVVAIPMHSSSDVDGYVKWGRMTYEMGLAKSFQGAYFPVQYLIFSGAYAISEHVPIDAKLVVKIFNLIFELGLLWLLYLLTRKYIEIWKLLIIYWLNPFSLILFDQGYVDPQIAFFIILTVFIIVRQVGRYPYLLAGVPLGIAFLMKPQATPIFIGIIILTVATFIIKFITKKGVLNAKTLGIFVFPVILFISFSVYFGLNIELKGHKTLPIISTELQKIGLPLQISDFAAKSAWLAANYAFVPKVMPALNAYMPNAWFFVAEPMRPPGINIYRVKDTQKLFGLTYRTWGLLIFLIILTLLILKIIKSNQTLKWRVLYVILLVPMLVPYIVTGAHENHFYYGFVTMILLGAFMSDKLLLYSAYLLGALNGINLFCLFVLTYYMNIHNNIMYPTFSRASVIAASSIIFFITLYHLMTKAKFEEKDPDPELQN